MADTRTEIPDITNGTKINQSAITDTRLVLSAGGPCETPEGVQLFPLVARVMCPGEAEDNSQQRNKTLAPEGILC